MKIIVKETENLYIINKSKFIGIIKKVFSEEDVLNILKEFKEQYHDATHICYAYILPKSSKCSDDKEPSGTAGLPILDVLKKNDLCYTLAIVIRYFGGIKLGSNGLIRSYSTTISQIIKDNIKDIEEGYLIEIDEDYKNADTINYLLKDAHIIRKDFQERIIIQAEVTKKMLENLSNIQYKILQEIIL